MWRFKFSFVGICARDKGSGPGYGDQSIPSSQGHFVILKGFYLLNNQKASNILIHHPSLKLMQIISRSNKITVAV